MRSLVAALILSLAAAAAEAHQLRVFASVADGIVTVEARFASGRSATSGDVRVRDASDTVILTLPLGSDGTAAFPVDAAASDGLVIEVDVGGGHSNYWILTPEDIQQGAGG